MSTLLMGMNVGDQDYALKMSSIRGWMRAKDLSKGDTIKIMSYYRAKHKGNSVHNEAEILDELPPALAGDIAFYMYGH